MTAEPHSARTPHGSWSNPYQEGSPVSTSSNPDPNALVIPVESPEVTLVESAKAARADFDELAGLLPGDTIRNALVAVRLCEELAEVAEMLHSLPAGPRQMSGHGYAALAAFRTAIVA
jgi:hypothetical protein